VLRSTSVSARTDPIDVVRRSPRARHDGLGPAAPTPLPQTAHMSARRAHPMCAVGTDVRGSGRRALPELLTAAVRAGTEPFAIAAVDGGERYWHRAAGDDPQAMLRDEVPGWLAQAGFGPVFGALGISMGGFGALLWARDAVVAPAAVITVSPALFRTWGEAKAHHAFVDEADWADCEPLRHLDAIEGSILGVWCGTEDPFVTAARELAAGTGAATARFDAGAHTEGYWRRVLPAALRFAGAAARGT